MILIMADVIDFVADIIATEPIVLSFFYFILSSEMLTEPHPICEADGMCLYFCLGMDC